MLRSAAMLPVMLLFVLVAGTPLSYVLYTAVGVGLIWLAHSDNIQRLIQGKERKFDLETILGRGTGGG